MDPRLRRTTRDTVAHYPNSPTASDLNRLFGLIYKG